MTRVLLVDDHPVVRHGIRQVLASSGAFTIAEASSADEALTRLHTNPFDIVVLDITLPGRSGLELLHDVKQQWPAVPVLVLSMHPATQFARRALAAGASGYLTKDSAPAELARAIGEVRAGRRYLSPEMTDDRATYPELLPHERLSDREYQVLRMLSSGRSVSQIASAMNVSVKTVSTYRARILKKMKLRTTTELIRYGIRNNLVD
jgi:DNA-binding NarL/FixJ family response regulator